MEKAFIMKYYNHATYIQILQNVLFQKPIDFHKLILIWIVFLFQENSKTKGIEEAVLLSQNKRNDNVTLSDKFPMKSLRTNSMYCTMYHNHFNCYHLSMEWKLTRKRAKIKRLLFPFFCVISLLRNSNTITL